MATRKSPKKRPAAAPARAGALAPPASGGSRRNSPWRAQTSTRQFRRPRAALGAAEGEGLAGSASPLPAAGRASIAGTAVGNDSSPRRRPGPVALVFAVRFSGCFRLAVIGRVSPRRASDFLVATRKSPKKRPAAAPASPVPSLHPRPAGRVETRPAGLRHRRDNSRRPPQAASALQKGRSAGSASPLPAASRASIAGTAVGNDSSPRRRPGQGFDLCFLVCGCCGWR